MTYKKSRIPTLLTFLHVAFLFAPLYILVGSMVKLEGRALARFSIMGAFVVFPVAISYVILRRVKRLFVSVLLTVILTGIAIALGFWYGDFFNYGNVIMGVMNGSISLIIYLFRTYSKIAHNEMKEEFYAVHDLEEPFLLEPWEIESFLSKPSLVHWAWLTILYVFALAVKAHYAIYEIFILLVIDVFICFVCAYSDHFFTYLKLNRWVANMPISSMRNAHRQILLVGLVVIGLFLLPAVIYHKEPLEDWKWKKPQAVPLDVPGREVDYDMMHMEMDTELPLLMAEAEANPYFEWVPYLLEGFMVVIAVASGIALIYGLIMVLRRMSKTFQLEDEDEVIDLDEVEDSEKKIRKPAGIQEHFSERAKIRRRYRKAIRKGTSGTPRETATPMELEMEANMTDREVYQELHEEYEKARYGKY